MFIITKPDINLCKTYQVLSGSAYLVGGKLSCADVQLLECTLMLEEKFPAILADYPNIKVKVRYGLSLDISWNIKGSS